MNAAELPTAWRVRAADLKRFSPSAAEAFEQAAGELEGALRLAAQEALSLRAAAAETGYSEDHLGRLVREGRLRSVGRRNAPKIRRADLPKKADGGKKAGRRSAGAASLATLSRDAASSRLPR